MKIALIYPPFLNSIRTTLPDFIDDNEGFFPPLGIMYIASYLKVFNPASSVTVIDSVAERLDCLQAAKKAVGFGADIVGISCWTFSLMDALKTAREVKRINPKVLVCLGGPHVNIYPFETLALDGVDFVIVNDGEKAFSELIKQIGSSGELAGVPNLYYRDHSGRMMKSDVVHMENDLDSLPFPDRGWTDTEKYFNILDDERPVTTMITSRGCPFKCSFCFQQDGRWRSRSAANIVNEMELCVRSGIRNFFVFDETFTVNKKRALELCDEIKKRSLNIVWNCRSRVDTIDEEVFDRMKEAGCRRISFGVESGNERVLKLLNKQISLKRVEDVFKMARKKGMVTLADFMVACPGEDMDASMQTIELAVKLNPDYAQFSLFTLLPSTKIYKEALETGVLKKDVWLEYAGNPSSDFKPPLWNIYSEEQARDILRLSYRRFYLRLAYIARKISRIRSFRQFAAEFKAGIGLIGGLLARFLKKANGPGRFKDERLPEA